MGTPLDFRFFSDNNLLNFTYHLSDSLKIAQIGTIPPGGVWGGGAPPSVNPLPSWLGMAAAAAAAAAEQKSCSDEAENRAASSLWVGDHRYQGISCMSKLLWVYSHLKSDFFRETNFLKSIQRSRKSLKIDQKLAMESPQCFKAYD